MDEGMVVCRWDGLDMTAAAQVGYLVVMMAAWLGDDHYLVCRIYQNTELEHQSRTCICSLSASLV
jgi:hypothetical protein